MSAETATAVKERPIIMQPHSVAAILAGVKTQTRRVCKPAMDITGTNPAASVHPDGAGAGWIAWWPNPVSAAETAKLYPGDEGFPCPCGRPGDRLWVKEKYIPRINGTIGFYAADLEAVEAAGIGGMYGGWRSSLFMPRKLSRLTLEITDIRIQRVQDISEEDAKAEGLLSWSKDGKLYKWAPFKVHQPSGERDPIWPWVDMPLTAVGAYAAAWDALNASRGFPWSANPWAWAITFRRVEVPTP